MTSFTMTEQEWRALGGTEPEFDYDPTEEKRVYPAKKLMGEYQVHHTGLVPTWGEVVTVWQDIAERLGIRLMSIRWPDAHYPDFTAELEDAK